MLMQAQTPQAFKTSLIKECYQLGKDSGFLATDDTSLVEKFKNIEIKNILCGKAETAISIMGLSERPVHHITFENVNITSKKPVFFEKAENIVQKNVSVIVESK